MMEAEVRERFEKIEAILHEMAERGNAMDRRMDRAEKRLDRAEKRMEKYDQRFEATRKLVEAGIRIVAQLGKRQGELEKSQKAFLDSLRRGDGNGRKH